ncbi:hypothetical protein SAMN05421761_101140 [Belliella pelovolcani]|uniref:Uncharacterized protein n=1 Tax=Belliella pelovolcani TaxID=529505 RepID=A0A1N7JMF6_9BACT|nr:hypothetical protein SAMN05421761_101140 [Belliella pelovolcani]
MNYMLCASFYSIKISYEKFIDFIVFDIDYGF